MEFNRKQLTEFNSKGYNSVSARYARSAEEMLKQQDAIIQKLQAQVSGVHSYLMGVQPENLTVEDALESLGVGRNGLQY